MNYNDQNLAQLTFFPQAYQTNLTASHKYLKQDTSPNKSAILQPCQSAKIFNQQQSNSKKQQSDRQKPLSQQGSIFQRKGSVVSRQQETKVPPLRSLNSEDKEKLIASLTQQIKYLNGQVSTMEMTIQEQNHKLQSLQQVKSNYDKMTEVQNKNEYENVLKQQKQELLNQFSVVVGLRIQIQHWMKWKKWVEEQKQQRVKEEKAKGFHQNQLKKQTFVSLLMYQQEQLFQKRQRKRLIFNKLRKAAKLIKVKQQQIILEAQRKKMKKILYKIKQNAKITQNKYNILQLDQRYFRKQQFFKTWKMNYKLVKNENNKLDKISQRYNMQLLKKCFQQLHQYNKNRNQEYVYYNIIQSKQEQKLKYSAYIQWRSCLQGFRTLAIQDQMNLIKQQDQIVQEQCSDIKNIEDQYAQAQQIIKEQDDQIANYKKLCNDSSQNEQSLIIQIDYLKQDVQLKDNQIEELQNQNDELKIATEQLNLANLQIQELKQTLFINQQTFRNTRNSYHDQDTIKKQLDITNRITQEQQQENMMLKQEYESIMIDYEKKIKDLEIYYISLVDQYKHQIVKLQRENAQLRSDNNITAHSRRKLIEEINILQTSFRDANSHHRQYPYLDDQSKIRYKNFQGHSPLSTSQIQQSPPSKLVLSQEERKIKEEALTLREDIKKRIATLKTQMDSQ